MTIGLAGFVFLVFLVLKLAGIGAVATWSWMWVTAPLWIGAAVAALVWIVFGAIGLAIFAISSAKKR